MTENTIRYAVRQILAEKDATTSSAVTSRPGRGGYKKSIGEAGALAQKQPQELMSRLKIGPVRDDTDIKRLNNLFRQAATGVVAMSSVYGAPQPRKDNMTGLEGIRIPVRVITPRDARKYLEHTLIGAQNSKTAVFDADIQVEILGNDVLIYFSDRPYSWGRQSPKSKQNKKQDKPKPPTSEAP